MQFRIVFSTSLLACSAHAQVPIQTLDGELTGEGYGTRIFEVDDVDGDGQPDIVVSAPGKISSSTQTAGRIELRSGISGELLGTAFGSLAGTGFGLALDGSADLNGDGVVDIAVGAPEGVGEVLAFDGARLSQGQVDALWTSEVTGGGLGSAVESIADVDGDGVSDYVVGQPSFDGSAPAKGRVVLLSGADGRLLSTVEGPEQALSFFGDDLAVLGDVNGDDLVDIAVSAPLYDGRKVQSGAVFLVSPLTGEFLWEWLGARENGQFGQNLLAGPLAVGSPVRTVFAAEPAPEADSGPGVVRWLMPLEAAPLAAWTGQEDEGRFGEGLALSPATDGLAGLLAISEPEASWAAREDGLLHLFDLADSGKHARWNGPGNESSFGDGIAWTGSSQGPARLWVGSPLVDSTTGAKVGRVEVFDSSELIARPGPRLWASKRVAPEGSEIQWIAALDADFAGFTAVLVGSYQGSPTPLILRDTVLPIAADTYLREMLTQTEGLPVDGPLPPNGQSQVRWTSPAFAGDQVQHALLVIDPNGGLVDVTNAVALEVY